MNILKPPKLKKGDVIKIIAPSSFPYHPLMRISMGIDYIRKIGYRVVLGETVKRALQIGYFAAPAEIRAKDLNKAFSDDKVKAIFCARGGIGALEILNYIDFEVIKDNPKIFVGYSDITAIQIALYQKCGLISFHGWMPGVYAKNKDEYKAMEKSIELLFRVIAGGEQLELSNPVDAPLTQCICEGEATGRLTGGNIIIFTHMVGTKFDPITRRHILFLEDIKEEPWRIENYFSSLLLANKLNGAAGFIFGEVLEPEKYDHPTPSTVEIVIKYLKKYKRPSILSFACCHGKYKLPLPIGGLIKLDADSQKIYYKEEMVS